MTPIIAIALNLINFLMLVMLFVYMIVKMRQYHAVNREAKELMELARQQQQIALDTVQGVRLAARGAQMDLTRTAQTTAEKIVERVKSVETRPDESGVVHLPTGAEVRIKAEPEKKEGAS